MSVTIVGSITTPVYGVTADETGINVSEFTVEVEPEFRAELQGKTGEVKGLAIGPVKRTVTVSGEYIAAVSAYVVTAATVLTGSTTPLGGTGGLYLTRGSVRESRGWKEVSLTFESYAGVT